MNSNPVEMYEAPEVLELGEAEALTLGCCGCTGDCCGCKECCDGGDAFI